MSTILKCEKCGEKYILGKDAMCITSEEMMKMTAVTIGQLPKILAISHAGNSASQDLLNSDAETIMRVGPTRDWKCERCKYASNKWNPTYSNITKEKRWWSFWK